MDGERKMIMAAGGGMKPRIELITCVVLVGALAVSCASRTEKDTHPSPFTHGNVQLTLEKGITTKAQVLETFGPPNVATTDSSGKEVWTYQKHATVSKAREGNAYATVILAGVGRRTSGFEQSSRTMTLILKFDSDDRLADFKSMTTSF